MDDHARIKVSGGLAILRSKLLDSVPGLLHGFTGRHGGVSQSPYGSLNLSHGVGEPMSTVVENRRLACRAMGVPFSRLTLGRQVHGDRWAQVGPLTTGRGRYHMEDSLPNVNSLLSQGPGIALGVLTADCAPVLLVDPQKKACAVVHAGWRGLGSQAVSKAVEGLGHSFGCSPKDLLAVIGPSIGACCYEVGPDLVENIQKNAKHLAKRLRVEPSGRGFFDVPGSARDQLLEGGLGDSHIECWNFCTAENVAWVYSRRVEGPRSGRFMGALMWA